MRVTTLIENDRVEGREDLKAEFGLSLHNQRGDLQILFDTGALIALFDRSDRHHDDCRLLYEENPDAWVLPWAILPEVDHLLAEHVGARAEERFVVDLASGAWVVEWGDPADLVRAEEIARRHRSLRLGLVDGVVMAVAEP